MLVNHKKILAVIQERQLDTFCLLKDFRDKSHLKKLPTKHRGLYWIWSNLSFDKLQRIPSTKGGIAEVPIKKLVIQRRGLTNVIDINRIACNGFTIVYNGKGGYETSPQNAGLRARIGQEFKAGKGDKTGSLNMENRHRSGKFNIDHWAVSYFDFDSNCKFMDKNDLTYEDAEDLERNWRLEYGTPILIRH